MNIKEGLERTLPDQEKNSAPSKKTPLLDNVTSILASSQGGISRRQFLTSLLKTGIVVAAAFPLLPRVTVEARNPDSSPDPEAATDESILSHNQFLQQLRSSSEYSDRSINRFRSVMQAAIDDCIRDNGEWVIPSANYADYYFSRDSYWLLAATKDRRLLDIAARRFHEDQRSNPDGHIATALIKDGSRPEARDRAEESTMMDVLREFERVRAGSSPDLTSLQASYQYISSQVRNGAYITTGETRVGPDYLGDEQLGTYHYWADTFRPAGRPEATAEVITYNQGLLCVALRCLDQMGVAIDRSLLQQAERTYSNMTNPADGISLPQRKDSTIMDVSALVGEALSFYYFDRSLLSKEKVEATLKRFASVNYPDGSFLGYKIISDFYGGYRPLREFSGYPYHPADMAGNYQNGGSWLLYDALALYAAARHGIAGATDLLLQRVQSELRLSPSSHEFIRTDRAHLGQSETKRDNYGWNTFVINLLP